MSNTLERLPVCNVYKPRLLQDFDLNKLTQSVPRRRASRPVRREEGTAVQILL